MIPGIGCRGRDSNPRSHGIPGKKSEQTVIKVMFFILNKCFVC